VNKPNQNFIQGDIVRKIVALLLATAFLWLSPAFAQGWPAKTVKIIVPVPAGTAPDIVGRLLADRLTKHYGQPFVVENIVGAGGLIATQSAVRATPDGYTFLYAGLGALVLDPYLQKNPGYDRDKDLGPVAMIFDQERMTIAVHPDVPAKTLGELVAYSKANPDKVSYGVTNVAFPILVGQWINKLGSTSMLGVTYKNSGQQMQDLLAGRIQWVLATPPTLVPFANAGKLRILAVDGLGRYPLLPDVPTISETFPGYRTSGMGILAAPRGISPAIVKDLNATMDRINKDPEYQKLLLDLSFQVSGAGTPESIRAFIRERDQYWTTILKELNVK
jgi:tripartite-type tricarboxylate transporter receptor subunit TctC